MGVQLPPVKYKRHLYAHQVQDYDGLYHYELIDQYNFDPDVCRNIYPIKVDNDGHVFVEVPE